MGSDHTLNKAPIQGINLSAAAAGMLLLLLLSSSCVPAGRLPAGMSLWGAGQQLVATGGLRALYQGNVVNVLRSAPARAVDFFAFDL